MEKLETKNYLEKKLLEEHDHSIMFETVFNQRYEELQELQLFPQEYARDPRNLDLIVNTLSQRILLDLLYNIKIGNLVFKK